MNAARRATRPQEIVAELRRRQPGPPAPGHEVARSFSRIVSRFVDEARLHMDQGQGIDAIVADPGHWFYHLYELSIIAKREGTPQPYPWFVAFCARLFDEQDGTREPPPDPTVN